MKLRNIYLGLKDQLPIRRLIRHILRGGFWSSITHPRTHFNYDGTPKVCYNRKETARAAAAQMTAKKNDRFITFGSWKCFHCDGYHIGKNNTTRI